MSKTARRAGLTLLEVLIASTIFLVLGGALVLFLRTGLDMWRSTELRRESFERAEAILEQLSSDLLCTFPNPAHGTGGQVDVIFLSDYDDRGRQRLRFVRTLAGEMRHAITQRAGSLTGGLADYDYIDDRIEMESGILRAPGGLQEVAYLLDWRPASQLLWRGVKSPIGGENSLFDDENIYNYKPTAKDPLPIRRCRPFADGVLYMEFNFWGAETRNWDLRDPAGGAKGAWDSTRGFLDAKSDSRHEWRDDIFPARVQIVLTLAPASEVRLARLRNGITAKDTVIQVDTTEQYPDGAFQYIRIDQEWIRYDGKDSGSFRVAEDGRGARASEARTHEAGTPVVYGYSFSRVVRIPGARFSNWREG